jgi:hypothetical protein
MADPGENEIVVRDNASEHRYDILVDGDLAGFAVYRDEPGRRIFVHTKVDPDYEGQGIGSSLARGALEDARARGLATVARCPFIAAYVARHPEFANPKGSAGGR